MQELLIPPESENQEVVELDLSQPETSLPPSRPPVSRFVFAFGLASLVVHFIGSSRYGFFRDELYYIACGNHLSFGYVDQPPLIAVIARLSQVLLGSSLTAFRFFPALAGACLVLLAGLTARELGGGGLAQALASVAVLFSPIYLAFGSFLSMNAFEPALWLGCACILARILNGGDKRLWLLFGAVAGIGLENKHTMLMFGFGILVGLIVTRDWENLRTKWVWLAAGLAFVIFLPNLIWEVQHNWPQVEVVLNCQKLKNAPVSAWRFLGEQILFLNPITMPVILAGLGWLLFSKSEKRFRALGWAFLIVIAVVKGLNGKTYYPVPYYSILLAAGAVAVEGFLENRKRLCVTYLAILALSGAIMLPLCVPVLPLDALLRYQNSFLPIENVVKVEKDSEGEVHQLYADMMGWENMVASVANVYHHLPPSEQKHCAILAGNYGEAGAIDLLGTRLGLPNAISGHNNYYYWGTNGSTGEVVILFGENAESTKTMFASVEQAGTISDRITATGENNLPIYICRHPKAPLAQLWPSLRYYE